MVAPGKAEKRQPQNKDAKTMISLGTAELEDKFKKTLIHEIEGEEHSENGAGAKRLDKCSLWDSTRL